MQKKVYCQNLITKQFKDEVLFNSEEKYSSLTGKILGEFF